MSSPFARAAVSRRRVRQLVYGARRMRSAWAGDSRRLNSAASLTEFEAESPEEAAPAPRRRDWSWPPRVREEGLRLRGPAGMGAAVCVGSAAPALKFALPPWKAVLARTTASTALGMADSAEPLCLPPASTTATFGTAGMIAAAACCARGSRTASVVAFRMRSWVACSRGWGINPPGAPSPLRPRQIAVRADVIAAGAETATRAGSGRRERHPLPPRTGRRRLQERASPPPVRRPRRRPRQLADRRRRWTPTPQSRRWAPQAKTLAAATRSPNRRPGPAARLRRWSRNRGRAAHWGWRSRGCRRRRSCRR